MTRESLMAERDALRAVRDTSPWPADVAGALTASIARIDALLADEQAWPGSPEASELWDAINEYTVACRGEPGKYVYGNTARMRAVTRVEGIVRKIRTVADLVRRP